VLIDSDSENTITSGSVLSMEEGYELRIKEIDTKEIRSTWLWPKMERRSIAR
jgi:hypothetical protein